MKTSIKFVTSEQFFRSILRLMESVTKWEMKEVIYDKADIYWSVIDFIKGKPRLNIDSSILQR